MPPLAVKSSRPLFNHHSKRNRIPENRTPNDKPMEPERAKNEARRLASSSHSSHPARPFPCLARLATPSRTSNWPKFDTLSTEFCSAREGSSITSVACRGADGKGATWRELAKPGSTREHTLSTRKKKPRRKKLGSHTAVGALQLRQVARCKTIDEAMSSQ